MNIRLMCLLCILSFFMSVTKVHSQTYNIYANDGSYLGNTSSNNYDPNSINNPYGRYGSQYSSDSIRNAYGAYGSQYSSTSPNNAYAQPASAIPQYGGQPQRFGGNPYGY